MNSQATILRLTEVLVSIAVILQCTEFFMIRKSFSEKGIWRWSLLRENFPRLLRVDFIFRDSGFQIILGLRLLAAILLLVKASWIFSLILTITTLFIALRWLGTFNGGSDYMTFLILYSVTIARLFENNERVLRGALLYIGVQACLSYFIAGFAKIRNSDWRSGRALKLFFNSSHYEVPEKARKLSSESLLLLSWLLILFECGFPFAAHDPFICGFFIAAALLFHSTSFFLFGLNRFFFAWLASYPALMFLAAR